MYSIGFDDDDDQNVEFLNGYFIEVYFRSQESSMSPSSAGGG